jgi:hypothetical protein
MTSGSNAVGALWGNDRVMAGILGGRRLLRFLAPAFGVTLLAGIAVLLSWPVAA